MWGHFCLLYLDGVASYVFMRCPPEDSILPYMCHDSFVGVTCSFGGGCALSPLHLSLCRRSSSFCLVVHSLSYSYFGLTATVRVIGEVPTLVFPPQ